MADGVSPTVDTNLGQTPMGATGAVGLMSDLAEMRNRQNANLLFQSQMSARHQLGEDLAVWSSQGLSPEEQIARASHQPYAPFVTPEIGNFRQSNLAGVEVQKNQAEISEIHQRMSNLGMGPITQALAATGGDPTKFDGAFNVATSGYPPELQKSLRPAFDAMKTAITGGTEGLPPDAAKAKVIENTRNLGTAFGLPLDKAYAMTGGVAPAMTELPTPSGAPIKAIVGGGGEGALGVTPLGSGPGIAEQEALRIKGAQAAGLVPSLQTVKTPGGAEQPVVVSGGGGGGAAVASPLLGASPQGGPQGGPQAPIVGPNLTQSKYLSDRGTDMAAYQQNLDDRVKMGQQIMQTITPAWEAMQDLKKSGQTPGGLASARMALAQVAQGLGADPGVVDKISKLDDTQEISKLMVNTTMAQITQQLPATSKVAVSEFNAFTKNNPNLDTDPRAIEKIFNFWSKIQGINRVEQTKLNEHLAQGGSISEWPAKWQDLAEREGYVNANPTGTGAGTKPRPPIESFFK